MGAQFACDTLNNTSFLFNPVCVVLNNFSVLRLLLLSTGNRKVLGSTPDRSTQIFSEYACFIY